MGNYIDIRVIRMIKCSSGCSVRNFVQKNKKRNNACVCLGHFDAILIDPVPTGNEGGKTERCPLEYIRQYTDEQVKSSEATSNAHLLYIIKQVEEETAEGAKAKFQEFWNEDSNYTVICRFHCDEDEKDEKGGKGGKGGKENMHAIQKLEKRCREFGNEQPQSSSASAVEEPKNNVPIIHIPPQQGNLEAPVQVVFYDSLDLSDIIGVFKSNSLAAILTLQCFLGDAPVVSDDYTYSGVSTRLLTRASKLIKVDSALNAVLPYVATRFSIKLAKAADTMLKKLRVKPKTYYVLGNEDLLVLYGECQERKFIIWIKKLIAAEKGHYEAFNDSITRVGLIYNEPINSRNRPNDKDNKYDDIINQISNIKLKEKIYKQNWLPTFLRLLSACQMMNSNCVTDDLSLLAFPSVNALVQRLSVLSAAWKQGYNEEVGIFLDAWSSLTEELYRVENQMSQHPELSLPQSYIPATLLLFYLCFSKDYEELLWEIDRQPDDERQNYRKYAPILAPSVSAETNTLCILDPRGSTEYTGGVPLVIGVPVRDLYQPWEMTHVLAHELSHYCGEIIRKRGMRWKSLCKCVAEFILIVWEYYLEYKKQFRGDERQLNTKHDEEVQVIADQIEKSFDGPPEQTYLSDIRQLVTKMAVKIACNYKCQMRYRRKLIDSADLYDQLRGIHKEGRLHVMELGEALQRRIPEHIEKCIIPLFKECFADIAMIKLLDCTFSDYYKCVYEGEWDKITNENHGIEETPKAELELKMKRVFEKHTDRIALVILAIEGKTTPKDTEKWVKDGGDQQWVDHAKKKVSYYRERCGCSASEKKTKRNECFYLEDIDTYALSFKEMEAIVEYLRACAKQIGEAVECKENKGQKDAIKRILENTKAGSFDWNAMREYIDSSKSKIIC